MTSNSVTLNQAASAINLSTSVTHVLGCNGQNTGAIDLTVTGGIVAAAYTYAWTTNDGTIVAGEEDDQDLNTLVAGTYTVVVTDDNNCTETVSVTINEPTAIGATSSKSNNNGYAVSCFNGTDGTATAVGSGGTVAGAYDYSWAMGK